MSSQLKLRRGSTVSHAGFTGADGEVTFNTDTNALVTHDGATAGGFPHTKAADLAASSGSSLVGYMPSGTGAVATTVQDKLRESISVLGFYANGTSGASVDPTGVVDSTAGIQAAIDSGYRVYFPAGIYKVSTLKICKGVHLLGDSNMFGYAPTAGLTFEALPKNVTVLFGTSTTAPLFDLDCTAFGGAVGGLLIEGFSFYQTQASFTSPTVYPYVIDDVNSTANYWSGLTIRDCCFLNCYAGIRLQHATKYNIYNIAGDIFHQGIYGYNSTDACRIDNIHFNAMATGAPNTYELGIYSDYGIILDAQDDTMLSRIFIYGRAKGVKLKAFWGSVSQLSGDTVGRTLLIEGAKPGGVIVDGVDIFGASNLDGINGAIEIIGTSSLNSSIHLTNIAYINSGTAAYIPKYVVYINDVNANILINGIAPKSLDTTVFIASAISVSVDNLMALNYCQNPAAFICNGALIQNESPTCKVFVGTVGSGKNDLGTPSAVSYYDGYVDNAVFVVSKPSLIPLYSEIIYGSGANCTYTDALGQKATELQQVWGAGAVGDYTGLRINPPGATYTEPGRHMFGVTYQTTTSFATIANDTRILDIPITAGDVDQYITFPDAGRAATENRRRYIRSLNYTGGLLTPPTAHGRLYQGKVKFFDVYLCKSNSVCSGFNSQPMQYAAAPVWGIYRLGEYIVNSNPVVGQPKGWRCTVAGTPGTWVSEGNL